MSPAHLNPWANMFTQSVSIAPRAGQDRFGNLTYGADVPYRARVVGKQRKVLNDAGDEVLSKQTCYLFTADPVSTLARVTLSTADVGSTEAYAVHPPILAVARYPDENGQHHTVLMLGG